jgi:1-acyl-sn-glycerol-3-phosphate acyltransferase
LLRFRTRAWLPSGITRIETANVEGLVDLYRQFQAGKIRFLMAFRHVEVDDPLSGMYLLSRAVPKVARQRGISLQYPIHTHFLYERGMPLWAGAWLGWLLSRLGGIPIHRGKHLDWTGLRTARDLLANGKLPMTVAPEGGTNGHSEIVSPLEPGVAQLGFWCVEDLVKAGRSEAVYIVPIGIQYRYVKPPWRQLDWLLSQLEADSGLPVQRIEQSATPGWEKVYYQRLFRLGEHLLSKMEQFYTRFYHQTIPAPNLPATDESATPNQMLAARLQALLHTALHVTEDYFGLQAQGSLIERCRRLEEAGWTYIYREDLQDGKALSPLDQGLADWIAEEASLRMLHMRLVESFVAVTGTYVLEKPTVERFAETALLMFDMLARIKGDKLPHRPRLGQRSVQITVGEPISVTDRWPTYQTSRKAARKASADLTQDLQVALEKMISDSHSIKSPKKTSFAV